MVYFSWAIGVVAALAAACYLASKECYALAFCAIVIAGSWSVERKNK